MRDERWEAVRRAADGLAGLVGEVPRIAVTLGSGLSDAFGAPEGGTIIPCSRIPGFPIPTVEGHTGDFWVGNIGENRVLIQRGRTHYYEGRSIDEVVFATRLFAMIGVETLVVTNASGAINAEFRAGDIVVLTDHINMLGVNPLRGPNLPELGERFPDMSSAYTPRLRRLAVDTAARLGIDIRQGVYVAALGPSYETPAEIRAFRTWGADLVGMSTVPEVIVAAHAGMDVLGLSIATNLAAGVDPDAALTHEEVIETTRARGRDVRRLLMTLLARI